MTQYTQNYSLPYPEGQDKVAVHADLEHLAKRSDIVLDDIAEQLQAGKFYRGSLSSSDRLDNLQTGTYWSSTIPISEAVGLPAGVRGTLVLTRSGDNGNALFISNGGGHEIRVYATDRLSDRWSPWTLVSSGSVVDLTADDDLDALTTGTYWSNTTTISEAVGLPHGVRGTLQLSRTSSNGNALFISNGGDHPIRVYASERLSGQWSPWELISGGAGGGSAEVTELHAFLVAGQSNMSGHGTPYGPDMDPVHPRILQYGSRNRVIEPATVPLDQHNPTVGLSIATVFAREYLKTQPEHVGVLLIAAARGASYLKPRPAGDYTWYPGGAAAPEYDLYEQAITLTQEAIAAESRAELKGVLWHQGEGNNGDTETEYIGYQDFMINSFRSDLNRPDLPFMLGELTPEGTDNFPGRKPVNAAIAKTPARLERTAFSASERGWAKYEDETHYSRSGVEALGKRYLHAFHVALSNTTDTNPAPPIDITARRTANSVTIRWVPPLCRVTEYRVESRVDDGQWQVVTRDNPMYPQAHLPQEATQARVIAVHDQLVSTPVILDV